MPDRTRRRRTAAAMLMASAAILLSVAATEGVRGVNAAQGATQNAIPAAPSTRRTLPHRGESTEEAQAASVGCVSCHVGIEHQNMHAEETVVLGCADCHGGDATVMMSGTKGSSEYAAAEKHAHVVPRLSENATRGGHPVRAYTHWIEESAEFVRFVNPGDLRVAAQTCGVCHAQETRYVKTSMMTHGAMLWGAALYNNGAFPLKNPHFGESYSRDGTPQRLPRRQCFGPGGRGSGIGRVCGCRT